MSAMNSCGGKKKKAPMKKASGGAVSGAMPMRKQMKMTGKWPNGGSGNSSSSKKCRW